MMLDRFDEMCAAVADAKQTLRATDAVAHDLAKMLEGRLRHVSSLQLTKLKAELKDFNAKTGVWTK